MFPLVAFKDNIVFSKEGEAFAIYKLSSYPYNYLPEKKKIGVIQLFEKLLYGHEGHGQVLFLNEELYTTEEEYLFNAGLQSIDEAKRHAKSVRQQMLQGARKRRKYLVLQLNVDVFESGVRTVLEEFRDRILNMFLNTKEWNLSPEAIERAVELEQELYHRIASYIDGRITFQDLDFIIRRNIKRVGILPPPLPSRDGGMFTPALLTSFSDGAIIKENLTHITITDSHSTYYQTFITFSDLAPSVELIDSEWLALVENYSASIDAVLHFEVIKPHKAAKKVIEKRKFLRGQMKEVSGSDEITLDEQRGYDDAYVLESKISKGQPLARMSVTFAVANQDLKEMRADAKALMESYTTGGYRAVRLIGDQLKCFYSFIPGAKGINPIECDPGYIASAGPNISLEIGDGTGCLLGFTSYTPVFYKPGYAAKKLSRSNAWMITGGLGGGKSFLMKYLFYLTYLSGGHLFIVDPKNNEYAVLERLFPIKKIDLCPGGESQVNPFMLSKDLTRAKDIAYTFLSIVLNIKNDARRVAVSEAVNKTAAQPVRNLHVCLEMLKKVYKESIDKDIKKEANMSIYLLEKLRDSDLGHTVFGTETVNYADSKATVVNLQGLPLPRTMDLTNIKDAERQGLGVLYLVATMAREIAFELPPNMLKAVGFDEAWMLLNISEGRRVLDEIARMASRTFGTVLVMATQNMSDIKEMPTLKNNVGYVACFKAHNKEEIRANLDLLGADSDDDILTGIFPNLKSGWCIMRDAYGRVGEVYIQPCPEDLLEIFDTSPE